MDASERKEMQLKDRIIIIKGAGEMASGVACRLFASNFGRILLLETDSPLAVRRQVSFCEAVHQGTMVVEGVEAVLVSSEVEVIAAWDAGKIAVRIDPLAQSVTYLKPDILIDAIIAKRNLGLAITDAPLVIALGPGFEAGKDCHVVVETNRGHDLGRLLRSGQAAANTGIPGNIAGYDNERVLRSPADGCFTTGRHIGDEIHTGDVLGQVGNAQIVAPIDGILRGLIRPQSMVRKGLKIGDIDPRGERGYCDTISEKARCVAGAVLEAILAVYNE